MLKLFASKKQRQQVCISCVIVSSLRLSFQEINLMSRHILLMATMDISLSVEHDQDTQVDPTYWLHKSIPTPSPSLGVVTFCRDASTPLSAEEGLTGVLSKEREDAVKCYGCSDDYTEKEVW